MKISKEKRDQLILVCLGIAVVLAGLYLGLISFQRDTLRSLASRKRDTEAKLQTVETAIKNTEKTVADYTQAAQQLKNVEEDMATGDLYSWMITLVRSATTAYKDKVDIPQFSTVEVKDCTLLPKFPYKQASMSVGGKAFYHDLGRFLAEFENQNPYLRVVDLDIQPDVTANEREKLTFRMEIIALVKPGAS